MKIKCDIKSILSIYILLNFFGINLSFCQGTNIRDGLIFQAPFDGDVTGKEPKTINSFPFVVGKKSIQYRNNIKNQILDDESSVARYKPNSIREIKRKESFVLSEFEKNSSLSFCSWFRTNSSNPHRLLKFKFNNSLFYFFELTSDNSAQYYITKKDSIGAKQYSTLIFPKANKEDWRLLTLSISEDGVLQFSISDKFTQTIASSPIIQLDTLSSTTTKIEIEFESKPSTHSLFIDDVRIYDRVITQDVVKAIASYDPNNLAYPAKYQLAYSYKLLADQYYIKASDISINSDLDFVALMKAKLYYDSTVTTLIDGLIDVSQPVIDSLKTFHNDAVWTTNQIDLLDKDKNKIKASIPFPSNYDLLLLDAKYRLYLIENKYSFWGKDFTDKPLYPVQEYNYFINTFDKFSRTYVNIEALLKENKTEDANQQAREIQAQIALHKSEIDKIKIDETQYKVGFYDQQLGSIDAQLKGIEQQQKQLTRDVERKENELKSLDAQIMSTFSQAISSQVLGVPIDPTKDLGTNIKNAGLSYLTSDNGKALSSSLLGSYKDIYDATNTARQYYEKGKSAIDAVKSIASGNVSPDNLFKIGDAISGSGIVNEQWVMQWNSIKDDYNNIEDKYKKAKELLQKVEATKKNPNLKNIVDFVDWISEKDYMPENYKKDYETFKGYREAAYGSIKNKRYDDIINLGLEIYNDPSLTADVATIRNKVKELKPTFVLLEMIKNKDFESLKGKIIELLLSDDAIDFIDPNVKNELLFKVLKEYLLSDKAITKQQMEAIYSELINNAPETFLNCFPINVREDLKRLLKAKDDKDLVAKLKTFKISDFVNEVKVERDTLFIYGEPYVIDISKYLSMDKQFATAIVKLYKDFPQLKEKLKTETDPLKIYKIFEKVLIEASPNSTAKSKEFYDFTIKYINDDNIKNQIIEEATKFYIGNGIFQSVTDSSETQNLISNIPPVIDPTNPDEIAGENVYSGYSQNGDDNKLYLELGAKALDMAFPGVGTATKALLSIADNIFSGYQIVDQLRNIYDQKVKLNEQYIKLLDRYKDNEFNKQLALYETKIANASYDVMLQEHEGYSKMINTAIRNKEDIRRKIAGQLPMMFFYAERLRYYYQRLNKASIFWYGSENSLNKIIFSDKNNLRLALDPDIKLFDWINSPDITSTREDLFKLFSYWSKLNALITDGITGNKLKYGDNISEISYTGFDIHSLNQSEWINFERWKKYPNTPYLFNLDLSQPLSPTNIFGFDNSFSSIKTIQVVPIVYDKNKNPINNLISISNMGSSINENGIVEPLGLRTRSSVDEFLNLDASGNLIIPTYYLKNLKYRWDSPNNDYQPHNFEGYNLRSSWRLTVDPKQDAAKIDKIYLAVFYQFTKNYNEQKIAGENSQYLYKVVITNNHSGRKEVLNIVLDTLNKDIDNEFLYQKYPKLKERENSDNTITVMPYLDSEDGSIGNGIIARQNNSNVIQSPIQDTKPTSKKRKCFLSRKNK